MTECPTCAGTRTVRLEPAGPGEWWWGPCRDCEINRPPDPLSLLPGTHSVCRVVDMDNALIATIVAAAAEIDAGWSIGLRIESACKVGQTLPASRIWDDGVVTGDLLDGTSAIRIRTTSMDDSPVTAESVAAALATMSIYDGSHLVLLAGEPEGYGEDDGEIIIGEAEVMAVWERA